MKYKDCMIDLETLGRRPGCAILSLGAVMFDPLTGELGPEFYTVISKESCMALGLHAGPATLAWWEKQSKDARTVLTEAEEATAPSLTMVCKAFGGWLKVNSVEQKDRRVWGNGASFDQPILSEAYRVTGVDRPWEYWGDMCYRTLKNLYPEVALAKSGVQHNALADAKQQAKHLMAIMFRMRNAHVLNRGKEEASAASVGASDV